MVFERVDREIAPMRATYEDLMAHPEKVERILLAGAEKARPKSAAFMAELRDAVGLRSLAQTVGTAKTKIAKTVTANFKQYREKDGQFYFKLVDAQSQVLLQSRGFTTPREAGQAIAQLLEHPLAALNTLAPQLETPTTAPAQELVETLNLLRETSKK